MSYRVPRLIHSPTTLGHTDRTRRSLSGYHQTHHDDFPRYLPAIRSSSIRGNPITTHDIPRALYFLDNFWSDRQQLHSHSDSAGSSHMLPLTWVIGSKHLMYIPPSFLLQDTDRTICLRMCVCVWGVCVVCE